MTTKFGRLALHMWTIDTTPLATALDAAKQGGFDAVELRRTDFKRCFDAGMSNAQVAEILDTSVSAVETLLVRGKQNLRRALASVTDEDQSDE